MLQFFGKFRLNIKIQPLYILFEAEFYADVKTGFIFDVRQKLWIQVTLFYGILTGADVANISIQSYGMPLSRIVAITN